METEFNLQLFLKDMRDEIQQESAAARREQRRRYRALARKIDSAVETLHNHEIRIVTVEGTRKSMLWLGGTMIVSLLSAAADFFFTHLPRFGKP